MSKTIVALYDDIVIARQVVEDLVEEDFPRRSISLITNDAQNQYSEYLEDDYAPEEDAVSAAKGAGFGAVVGVLTGALVGLASLTIPGVGLVIVAGPIVAGLTGALAGTVTGGVAGALIKSGVPKDDAPYYAEGIRRGGTLISIETSNTLVASDIMNRYGTINVHERSAQWRQDGWQGLDDVESIENEEDVKSDTSISIVSDTTTTRITHLSRNAPVQTPVEEESSGSQTNPEVVPTLTVLAKDEESPDTSLPDTDEANSLITDEPPLDEVDTKEIIPIKNES